ncbi:MAG: zinc metalloprotease HtpX [Pseudomonadota bacterium]
MPAHLSETRSREHQQHNLIHTTVLIGGIGGLMLLCAYLLSGWFGVFWTAVIVTVLKLVAPRVPAQVVMGMYGARPVDPVSGAQLLALMSELSRRAELPVVPQLYVIPSMTLNAFATGHQHAPAVAVTESLLRKLSLRELAGVLAHEVAHIRNDDLHILGLADIMSRVTQLMSYAAIALLLWHLPAALAGTGPVPWMAIILLYLAPTFTSLLQLGLSRTREYDADLEGALLTGDPDGLAMALNKLERYHGKMWEDLVLTGRCVRSMLGWGTRRPVSTRSSHILPW